MQYAVQPAGRAELPDEGTAWIFEDTLRRWPGVENDTAWQEKFSAMIEKARPHGWIDDQRKAIKAHSSGLPPHERIVM